MSRFGLLVSLCLIIPGVSGAEELTGLQIQSVVRSLTAAIEKAYVDPIARVAYTKALGQIDENHPLLAVTEPDVFQVAITDFLQEVSRDGHLRVYAPSRTRELILSSNHDENHEASEEGREHFLWVEPMSAAVRIRISHFPHGRSYEEEAVSVFQQVARNIPLILDLRGNMGGSASTVRQILNCLLPPGTPLYRVRVSYGEEEGIHDHVSSPVADCDMAATAPLIVLTDPETASAAELLTLILKNRGRATVIGETTYGAGRPVELFELAEGFSAYIPISTIEDLETKEQFELTGVEPDIRARFP